MASANLREVGLRDERNVQLMNKGYPPGPPKSIAKKLDLRNIETYTALHEEFGDIFMLPLGDVPLVVTRDPVQIRELLGGSATERFPRPPNVIANVRILFNRAQIALDGEEHQANKRMLSQWLFAEPHNAMMVEPFSEVVVDFVARLEKERVARGGAVEAYALAELASADVSSAISMGKSYKALETGKCAQLDALKACDRIFLNRAMNKKWRETEPKETTEEFDRNKQVLADTFADAFARIKGGAQLNHNILSHMVEHNLLNRSGSCPMGHTPTELEAVSNMIGFLAGVGNTARMLTIPIELCAQHQEVQTKVLEELHRVLGGKSAAAAARGEALPAAADRRLYTYDKLMQLHYLKCVMMECLRLYTPSTSVAPRHCTENSPLGQYTIPAGTNVMCNLYGAHRHPAFWPDPLRFDPLRFNEAAPGEPVRAKGFAKEGFFPFSIGGHSCIGRNLAQEFAIMLWAATFGTYRVFKAPSQKNAHFNTLHSDQILGFIEAVEGSHVSLAKRPLDQKAEALARKALDLSAPTHHERLVRDVQRLTEEQRAGTAATANELDQAVDRNRPITMAEVKKHASKEAGFWFVISGKVYDVTPWLRDHPGGADVLMRNAGKDVTRLFEITKHSTFAVKEADKYQCGVLAAEPAKL